MQAESAGEWFSQWCQGVCGHAPAGAPGGLNFIQLSLKAHDAKVSTVIGVPNQTQVSERGSCEIVAAVPNAS